MTVLFEAEVPVHYGFVFLCEADEQPDLMESRAGQRNGLCGAALPGGLAMVTGLHTGRVPFVVRWHDAAPPIGGEWEDVVEVPFRAPSRDLVLSSFQDFFDVRLPRAGDLRARYCASGMDAADAADTIVGDAPTIDRYLLELWPAAPAPDEVLRQTSAIAGYWHGTCPRRPPRLPEPEPEEDDDEAYEAYEIAERWGGRTPGARLRAAAGSANPFDRFDRDAVFALAELDDDTHRAVARWAAERACDVAGLSGVPEFALMLAAVRRGERLPAPFDDHGRVWQVLDGPGMTWEIIRLPEVASGGEMSRTHVAVPALLAAADPDEDSLRAALDALWAATAAHGEDGYRGFLTRLRERFPGLGRPHHP